jgi:hypothetical protein
LRRYAAAASPQIMRGPSATAPVAAWIVTTARAATGTLRRGRRAGGPHRVRVPWQA